MAIVSMANVSVKTDILVQNATSKHAPMLATIMEYVTKDNANATKTIMAMIVH